MISFIFVDGKILLQNGIILQLPRAPLHTPTLTDNQWSVTWSAGFLSVNIDTMVDFGGELTSIIIGSSVGDPVTYVLDPDAEPENSFVIPFDFHNQSGWILGQATFSASLTIQLFTDLTDSGTGGVSQPKTILIDQTGHNFVANQKWSIVVDTNTAPAGHRLRSIDFDVRLPAEYEVWGYSGPSSTGPTAEDLALGQQMARGAPGDTNVRSATALEVGSTMFAMLAFRKAGTGSQHAFRATSIIGPTTVADVTTGGQPVNTVAPTASGTGKIGAALTGTLGTWTGHTGSPVGQWMRDDVAIPGATGLNYTPVAADDRSSITFRSSATNTSGQTAHAISNAIAIIFNAPTVATVIPNQNFTIGSGQQTLDVKPNFAVDGDASLAGVTWSISGPATISTAGIVTMQTSAIMSATNVTVTATNSGTPPAADTFTLSVTASTDFPALLADGDWTVTEERDSGAAGGVNGKRKLTLLSGTVPAGFKLEWYSGLVSGGDPGQTQDVSALRTSGGTVLTNNGMNTNEIAQNAIYWHKTATGEKIKAGTDKAPLTILGLLTGGDLAAHPRGVVSSIEISLIRSRIQQGLEPHAGGYARLKTAAAASLNFNHLDNTYNTGIPNNLALTADSAVPGDRTVMRRSGEHVFNCALLYALGDPLDEFTGPQLEAYADKAWAILLRWATRNGANNGVTMPASEGAGLHVGSHLTTFAYGYDLLLGASYATWLEADKTKFKNWCDAEVYPCLAQGRTTNAIGLLTSANHLDAQLNGHLALDMAFDRAASRDACLDDLHKYVVRPGGQTWPTDWAIRSFNYGPGNSARWCRVGDITRMNGTTRQGIQYTGYGGASIVQMLNTSKYFGRTTYNTPNANGGTFQAVYEQYLRWRETNAPLGLPEDFTYNGVNAPKDLGADEHRSVYAVALKLWNMSDTFKAEAITHYAQRGLVNPHPFLCYVDQAPLPFPAQIATDRWSVTEIRTISPAGRAELRTLTGIVVPAGFRLRWYYGTTQGGVGTVAATRDVSMPMPGIFTSTNALSVGQTAHNSLYWERISDGQFSKASTDKPGYLIQGLQTAPPTNVTAPAVTGQAVEGQTLTVSDGTWNGSPAPTFAYQWRRGGTNIGGATANTRLLTAADVGFTIDCVVTATNASGSLPATSNAVGPVTAISSIPSIAESVFQVRSTIPSDGATNDRKVRIDIGAFTLPAGWDARVTRTTVSNNDPNSDGISTAITANTILYSDSAYPNGTDVFVKFWVHNEGNTPKYIQTGGQTRTIDIVQFPAVGTLPLMNADARADAIAKPPSMYNHAASGGSWSNCGFFGPAAIAEALSAFSGNADAITACVNQINFTTAPNARQEPLCAGGYWNQHETHVTAAISIYRHTPAVWNHANVSDITRQRLDLIARAAAISSMYMMSANGLSDGNNGPNMRGSEAANTRRVGGAININAPMSATVLSSMAYFGGHAAMQTMANNFNLAAFVTEATNLGMLQIKETFNARNEPASVAKGIVPGAAPTAGQLATSLANWTHLNGRPLSDVTGLFTAVINQSWGKNCYTNPENGINILSNGTRWGRTIRTQTSPFAGLVGMFTEYAGGDGGGDRDSTHYAITSPQSVINAIAAHLVAGIYPKAALAGLVAKMHVGWQDCQWKLSATTGKGGGHIDWANGGAAGTGTTTPARWSDPGTTNNYGGRYREAIWFEVVYPTISS